MKSKAQIISIMVFVLGVVLSLGALALWVGAYSPQGNSAPAAASPTVPQTTTRAPTPTRVPPTATPTPVASATSEPGPTPTHPQENQFLPTVTALFATATAESFDATATAMAELGTILPPSPTPEVPPPTPTMTAKEQALVEEQQARAQGAASPDGCSDILQNDFDCIVPRYATRITRPEWETLFPHTEFFLVKTDVYGSEFGPEMYNKLIIESWWNDRLSREDFHTLMGGEHVAVTDENRKLVAKAFVLISLADYIEEEIVFSDWEEGSWPSAIRKPYGYKITAWTKIQGLRFEWYFLFHEGELLSATGGVFERNVGDYIDVPFERLPVPSRQQLSYWRKQ